MAIHYTKEKLIKDLLDTTSKESSLSVYLECCVVDIKLTVNQYYPIALLSLLLSPFPFINIVSLKNRT